MLSVTNLNVHKPLKTGIDSGGLLPGKRVSPLTAAVIIKGKEGCFQIVFNLHSYVIPSRGASKNQKICAFSGGGGVVVGGNI